MKTNFILMPLAQNIRGVATHKHQSKYTTKIIIFYIRAKKTKQNSKNLRLQYIRVKVKKYYYRYYL